MTTPAAKLSQAEAAALTIAVAVEMGARLQADDAAYLRTRVQTVRHENPHVARDPGDRIPGIAMGGNRRQQGKLTRFSNEAVTQPVIRAKAGLHPRHPAVIEGRTVYPTRVFHASERGHVLIAGINNAKIGSKVTKGPWSGFPIYTLALEERATCPRSCVVWRECYGNAMPLAVRFHHDAELMQLLRSDLSTLCAKHPKGFVVRLHVLGDFVDRDYVVQWAKWLGDFPQLHVWGYTAHPQESEIGAAIKSVNATQFDRWAVRFSVGPDVPVSPMQACVTWDRADPLAVAAGELICPQELGKTDTCGTCALCWSPEARELRIKFMGHGRS